MPDYYYGTIGNDTIYGSNYDDIIYGGPNPYSWQGEGQDTLYGNGGNDTLHGGENADKLVGGAGNDELNGGDGNDEYIFSGSFGQDLVSDYSNLNKLLFSDLRLADVTFEYDGSDLFIKKNGSSDQVSIDNYSSYKDHFSIQFKDGVYAEGPSEGNDSLNGDHDDDVIDALGGNDEVHGGYGNDRLVGGLGNDRLYGDAGDDVLEGGFGNDSLTGGSGIDEASWWSEKGKLGVTVDLATGRATRGAETDTLSQIEKVTGTENADSLSGSSAANFLNGAGGSDKLYGLGGNDILNGGNGNDLLDGGAAVDLVDYARGNAVKVDLGGASDYASRGAEKDTLVGIEGAIGSAYADSFVGDGGNNLFRGGLGKDTIKTGAGRDVIDYDAKGDSGLGAKRDVITDFQARYDDLDLSGIDARAATAANEPFAFVGSKAFTAAGQVGFTHVGSTTIVRGNVDGNLAADFEIQLTGKIALTAADFVL
jgi:Ca2+-binding RTX toxin-like protein